jgi:hypothetical protein
LAAISQRVFQPAPTDQRHAKSRRYRGGCRAARAHPPCAR